MTELTRGEAAGFVNTVTKLLIVNQISSAVEKLSN